MKFLHILRSEPDDLVRLFIRGLNAQSREVALYRGSVDTEVIAPRTLRAEPACDAADGPPAPVPASLTPVLSRQTELALSSPTHFPLLDAALSLPL